jgi:FAD/FMN-containing dehydrogenase
MVSCRKLTARKQEENVEAANLVKNDGNRINLDGATVEVFAERLRGELLTPSAKRYDEVRAIWNAMIDKRPGLIARCAGAADVISAIRFAQDHDLLVSVRGIGHNIAGNSVCDDGLMIDLSTMSSVRVDPQTSTVRTEPGVTLGHLDRETQAFRLAVPVGINSTTGIAGLTLGGGFGWLSRKHGLTIDNLVSADVVTASGELVRADAQTNPDLFWGIRGGGGNFGVVTSFEFEAHPIGPEVLSGLIVHPFTDARSVMQQYREVAEEAPDELTAWCVLRKAPPLPFLPEEVHGTNVLIIALLYAGPIDTGEEIVKPLRAIGNPIADVVSPHVFTVWQAAFDPLLTPGSRNYWKSHNFASVTDDLIDVLLRFTDALPTPQSEIFLAQLGGATNRVAKSATAYLHRDAAFALNVHTRWEEGSDDERCVAWARDFFEATAPHATGGVYVNFMPDDEAERIKSAYGDHYDRLVELKNKYDPTNLFRLNQNIKPTV